MGRVSIRGCINKDAVEDEEVEEGSLKEGKKDMQLPGSGREFSNCSLEEAK